jgi:DNA-binding NarL/FixJ family response regulator
MHGSAIVPKRTRSVVASCPAAIPVAINGSDRERCKTLRCAPEADAEHRFTVVATGAAAEQVPAAARPELVVIAPARGSTMDLRVLQALRLAVPRARLVVRSRLVDHTAVPALLPLGVCGYLVAGAEPGRRVCDALALVAETSCCILAPSVLEAIRHDAIGRAVLPSVAPPGPALSEREAVVLRLLAGDAGYDEFAAHLALSERRVRRTARALRETLGARSLAQLRAQAWQRERR